MNKQKNMTVRIILSCLLLLIPLLTGETIYAEETESVYVSLTVEHQYKQSADGMVLHYSLNVKNLSDAPAQNLELAMKHTGGPARFYPQLSVQGWRCITTEVVGEQCIWSIDKIPGHVTLGLTFAILLDDAPPHTTPRSTHVILKAPSANGKIYSEHLHVNLQLPVRGQSQTQFYLPLVFES